MGDRGTYRTFIRSKVALIVFSMLMFSSCQVSRFVVYNFADIRDYKKFKSRPLTAEPPSFQFYTANNRPLPVAIDDKPLETFLEEHKTVAFLVIRRDTILYEQYFRGFDEESIVPSFSMAKSVTSILIGCAIDDGLIGSVDEPVTNYLPELIPNGFEKVTLRHLLNMESGIAFNESYVNPFGHAASFYYGLDLRKAMGKMELEEEPGTSWRYKSGDSQLLGWVLERALKGKTITQYLEEKLWVPLGMEYDASWSIDSKNNGLEKTFCCLNARARDFAKIGRLYLQDGNWNGRQIVSKEWVETSTTPDPAMNVDYYRYQWWLPNPGQDFMAEGILGQFVYVRPSQELIIVRLGKKYAGADWASVFAAIVQYYEGH